ncbi:MAG TPA: hypothetical protein VMY39_06565, partial [Planctomycetota bacterium]|nr:hypothetical protein [Planctomycetota bacterium]
VLLPRRVALVVSTMVVLGHTVAAAFWLYYSTDLGFWGTMGLVALAAVLFEATRERFVAGELRSACQRTSVDMSESPVDAPPTRPYHQ